MMNKLYDLQLFAGEANTQTTGHGGLSAEMKVRRHQASACRRRQNRGVAQVRLL